MADMKGDVTKIIELIGGKDNIESATHCITRLRLILKDQSKVNDKELEKVDIVQGTFLAGGQFQIVIGPSVPKVYDEFIKQTGVQEASVESVKQEGRNKQGALQRLVRLLGDIFIPIIPAIVAAGLLMGINNVLSNKGIFYPNASFIQMHTEWKGVNDIIQLIAQTSFSFLPALIGWSAVKKFGGNPLLGIVLGLILVNPALTSAYDYASHPAATPTWNLFGWHVSQVGYQGQVIPVLVAAWVLVKLEKYFEKHLPDTLQLILVAPLTLLITGFASFLVIGPVTMTGANWITKGVVSIFNAVPVLGGALYGFICAPLVITGMHHLFLGVNLQMAGTLGYVTLWPVGEPVTMAQGAACLAMAYIFRKDAKKKNVAWSSGLSSFLGITEPAIYGVNLKNRYPFVAVMLSGAFGGAWMGFWQVRSSSVGVGGVLSFLSVFPKQWGFYLAGEVMTFILTIVLTFTLSRTKLNADRNIGNDEVAHDLTAFATGKTEAIENVPDEMFSKKQLGDGIAINPTSDKLVAPANGQVTVVMQGSNHAVGLTLNDGTEVLLHIGVDTVDMKGDGFKPLVEVNDHVKAGQTLIKFDSKKIKAAGHSNIVIMAITKQGDDIKSITYMKPNQEVIAGKSVVGDIDYLADAAKTALA
ncbi:phosphoenolpyruvate-dependent sugar phosphotransferase system EIIBCA [Companilactobacillus paralimentarius DSM 13238 = JCM 10415]|uniref:Phosphoenolpyruvate-dependent sugar phosphotransferase system EIIBCA n=2 Tax=Companilactobacillus paralimentarius TaxID=83526 RepID=A0A0R1PE34_9LACO|nr:PTS sugar transporter subunit IIBCA [Companilactobacillus paralimentarius]KRL30431.1 phosphoenolpyruvate-dependent sugar phosphotransferase system EIIBCA [Companilactobacillus paralimentarius DSM 13238 = JCM 10415]MDR4932919.1 glucose PTS transporter subunit IIA [Companilactobacillus paralimentarius]